MFVSDQQTKWFEDLRKWLEKLHQATAVTISPENIVNYLKDSACVCIYIVYTRSREYLKQDSSTSGGIDVWNIINEFESRALKSKLKENLKKVLCVQLNAPKSEVIVNGITTVFINRAPNSAEYTAEICATVLHNKVSSRIPVSPSTNTIPMEEDVLSSKSDSSLLKPPQQEPRASLPLQRKGLHEHGPTIVGLLSDIRDNTKKQLEATQTLVQHTVRTADASEEIAKGGSETILENRNLLRQLGM